MEKKFFLGIIACGLTGIGLGYWGAQQKKTTTLSMEDKPSLSMRAPKYKADRKKLSSSSEKTNYMSNGSRAIERVFQEYARLSPEEIEKELIRLLLDKTERKRDEFYFRIKYLMRKCAETSVLNVMAQMDALHGYSRINARNGLMANWAEKSPEKAYTYFQENKNEFPEGKVVLWEIMRSFGKHSPEKGWSLLESMDYSERTIAIPSFIRGICSESPEKMESYVSQLTAEDLRSGRLVEDIVWSWAEIDWDRTNKWIEHQSDEKLKSKMRIAALRSLAKQDMETAKNYYESSSEDDKQSMNYTLLRSLSYDSPMEALDWMMNNESIKDKERYAYEITDYLLKKDREELLQKVETMPEGELRDSLLHGIASDSRSRNDNEYVDMEQNMTLAASIKNESKRIMALDRVASTWISEDAQAADTWIKNSTLPPEKKQEYRTEIELLKKQKNEYVGMESRENTKGSS